MAEDAPAEAEAAPTEAAAEGDPAAGPKAPVGVITPSGDVLETAPEPQGIQRLEAPAESSGLVVPERVGDVVSPHKVKIAKKALRVPVTLPTTAGKYRLTVVLHDADGIAYDAASQAMIPSLIVRITGDFDGDIAAAASADLTAGADVDLGVRVRNLGIGAWGKAAIKPTSNLSGWVPASKATLVGRWIPLAGGAVLPAKVDEQSVSTDLPIGLAPGKSHDATLSIKAPKAPGSYLLLLDVVTPDGGSLVASGANPTLVRVTVLADAVQK